ncbi:MaoC family dehydratase [Kitasatospora sp. Ki12]
MVHLAQEIHTHTPLTPGDLDITVDVAAVRREARGTRLALATPSPTPPPASSSPTWPPPPCWSAPPAPRPTAPSPRRPPRHHPDTEPLTYTHTLTPADTTAYAQASGDLNPIHLDDDAARAAGFPSAIAHGMHLVALAAEEITDRHAGATPPASAPSAPASPPPPAPAPRCA